MQSCRFNTKLSLQVQASLLRLYFVINEEKQDITCSLVVSQLRYSKPYVGIRTRSLVFELSNSLSGIESE